MMTVATVLTLACTWLAGHALLLSFRPRRPRGPLEREATALLLGLAFVPALYVAIVAVLGPLSVGAGRVLLVALALPGLLDLRPRRGAPELAEALPPERVSALHAAGIVVLALFCGFAVFDGASMPVHVFDPVFHFAYKGKLLFHEGLGTASWTDCDGDVGRIITHPTYPPGLPALQCLVSSWAGEFDEDATRGLLGFLVVAPALLAYATLRPRGRAPALAAALLWTTLPILYYTRTPHYEPVRSVAGLILGWHPRTISWLAHPDQLGMTDREVAEETHYWAMPDGQTLDGAGDLPLAAFLFGAFVFLWRLLPSSGRTADGADAWIAGVMLGGAMLAKNEGVALAGVLLVAVVPTLALARLGGSAARAARARPRLLRSLAICVLTGAALTLAWQVASREIPKIDENYPELLRPHRILRFWGMRTPWLDFETQEEERIPIPWAVGYHGFLKDFVNVFRWNLLWPLFFGGLAWAFLRPRRLLRDPAMLGVWTVLGALALYFLVLVVTPWRHDTLFRTVIPGRLMLHVAPIVAFATALLLWRGEEADRAEASDG